MKFLILNFFIKALLNATYEINPIDYSHKTVAHYNTYHTSITEWSILKPLITVLRTWYILPVHYISVQYSHSNSTPYMDTPNCPVMVKWQMDGFSKSELNGTISAGGTEAVMHSIQPHDIDPIIIDLILLRSAILWYIIPWVLKICHPGDVRDDLKFVWDVLQKIPTKFYQLTNFFRFCAPLKHEIPQTHFNWYFWHLGYIS